VNPQSEGYTTRVIYRGWKALFAEWDNQYREGVMRKPISKHGLRRALERVHAEGHLEYKAPVGTVVDKLWHELEKKSYAGTRKKPMTRDTVRTALPDPEVESSS
jgi:hypothetical protein